MKHLKLTILIFAFLLFGCYQADKKITSVTEEIATTSSDDEKQIHDLIRNVLVWADSENSFDVLPFLYDSNDSIYIGFDLKKHKQNLNTLQQTNFFATEFIENYDQIILTLDKKHRNGEYEQWLIGELPTFMFANDHSPWCNCQDHYDWNKIEVRVIKLTENKGELEWTWGNLNADSTSTWKDFAYKFRVVKENNIWKISYLSGFDYEESIRRVGTIDR